MRTPITKSEIAINNKLFFIAIFSANIVEEYEMLLRELGLQFPKDKEPDNP
jgi:hypothetical protein